MKKKYIIRYGEIALKGLNKPFFEKKLAKQVEWVLKNYEDLYVYRRNGIMYVEITGENINDEDVIKKIRRVFGIASVSQVEEVENDIEKICEAAIVYMKDLMEKNPIKTFKVEGKRGDKKFHLKSPEIARIVGGEILGNIDGLKVDVHNPEKRLYIDVRTEATYLYTEKHKGYGGLPLGTNGTGMLLLSGGIDSPVAGWMLAKRGVDLQAMHYHSYPFTSERAKEKVVDLAKILASYCGTIKLYSVNLLDIQKEIHEKCPEREMTILSRRFMMQIAERVAKQNNCNALITGESLGQVASQTIEGIGATNQSVNMPVLRPLIAMDKVDIMDIARDIGTYETSILPFEDCCTVFLPKHPVTKPNLEKIIESESILDVEQLIDKAVEVMEVMYIK